MVAKVDLVRMLSSVKVPAQVGDAISPPPLLVLFSFAQLLSVDVVGLAR